MGTLRLLFTAADLARTTMLARPDPMWELVLSVHALPQGAPGDPAACATRLLRELVPRKGNFPDFLTPPGYGDLDASIEAIITTSRKRLRSDLMPSRLGRASTAYTRLLGNGDRESMSALVTAVRDYHRHRLMPRWDEIHHTVVAEHAATARVALTGGLATVLAGLGETVRWRWPVLAADYPQDHEIALNGRGLTLVPSYFCTRTPVTLIEPELAPVLVYPARRPGREPGLRDEVVDRLGAVLGKTRAAILADLHLPMTTSQLAGTIGMSLASASQHVTLLRAAGLVTSRRTGQSVTHSLTHRGRALTG